MAGVIRRKYLNAHDAKCESLPERDPELPVGRKGGAIKSGRMVRMEDIPRLVGGPTWIVTYSTDLGGMTNTTVKGKDVDEARIKPEISAA